MTVLFDLNPLLVMSHFLVAVTATGLAAALLARLAAGAATPVPRRARLARRAPASLGGLRADRERRVLDRGRARTPAAQDIRRMGNLLDATYVHVRVATTYVVIATLLLLVLQYGSWRPDRWRGLALALIVLLPLQAFIGEYQWHNQLPWWVVLAHVSVAAAVWIVCVSLATRVVARGAPASSRRSAHAGRAAARGDLLGHLARGLVDHLALPHHRAAAIALGRRQAVGLEQRLGAVVLRLRGAVDLVEDLDLRRVQRPLAVAAEPRRALRDRAEALDVARSPSTGRRSPAGRARAP